MWFSFVVGSRLKINPCRFYFDSLSICFGYNLLNELSLKILCRQVVK